MAYTNESLRAATDEILRAGTILDARGWTPATSGNFSQRLDEQHCAITASGKHKGRLTVDDVLVVDLDGRPKTAQRPSAETLLHTRLYARYPAIGAALHVHSVSSTLLSRLTKGDQVTFSGYELQKAFAGVVTHDTDLVFPIFENSQDMTLLADQVDARLETTDEYWGYFIRGHGAYAWGATMEDALRHVEALDFLSNCELQLLNPRASPDYS